MAVAQAHPWGSGRHLRDCVLPCVLAGTTHDEQVAGPEHESVRRRNALHGTQVETSRASERDDRNHGFDLVETDSVGVPCNGVVSRSFLLVVIW